MDEKLVDLFRQWLKAFEIAQGTMSDDFGNMDKAVAELEMRIAATPAEGLRGLVVKLGLHQFLSDHADATSSQIDSAYSDLVRLTGHDPARDIYVRGLPISLLLAPAGENFERGIPTTSAAMARTGAPLAIRYSHENREQDDVTDRQPSLEHGSNLTADETRNAHRD
jgi:hypothetical protein